MAGPSAPAILRAVDTEIRTCEQRVGVLRIVLDHMDRNAEWEPVGHVQRYKMGTLIHTFPEMAASQIGRHRGHVDDIGIVRVDPDVAQKSVIVGQRPKLPPSPARADVARARAHLGIRRATGGDGDGVKVRAGGGHRADVAGGIEAVHAQCLPVIAEIRAAPNLVVGIGVDRVPSWVRGAPHEGRHEGCVATCVRQSVGAQVERSGAAIGALEDKVGVDGAQHEVPVEGMDDRAESIAPDAVFKGAADSKASAFILPHTCAVVLQA